MNALQQRASKALDRMTQRNRAEDHFATGRQNKDHHLGPHMDIDAVTKGVTIGWLAQAMDMNHDRVKRRLANCPPLRKFKNGFVYDFKVAVGYLVEPVFDIEEYIKQASIKDLPLRLQTEFYNAQNKKIEFELTAGNLWPTEKVFEMLGSVFKTIKSTVDQWAQTLEDTTGLTDAQRALLRKLIDGMQDKLHKQLLAQATNGRPLESMLADEKRMEEAEKAKKAKPVVIEEEEEFDVSRYV